MHHAPFPALIVVGAVPSFVNSRPRGQSIPYLQENQPRHRFPSLPVDVGYFTLTHTRPRLSVHMFPTGRSSFAFGLYTGGTGSTFSASYPR